MKVQTLNKIPKIAKIYLRGEIFLIRSSKIGKTLPLIEFPES